MKIKLLILSLFFSVVAFGQISENIQSWTNHASYGNYTQAITAGTVTMTNCIVANAASATGTCTVGRVQLGATTGIVELPTLPSVGTVEIHAVAGAAGRSLTLQSFDGTVWNNLTTWTGIGTTGATYTYVINSSSSTTLRLASPSAALYVHDIIINLMPCSPAASNPAGTISGTTPSCGATTLTYSTPSATEYWQTTASGTSTTYPTTLTYSAATTGTYYVRAYNGTCWSSGTVSKAVVINTAIAIGTNPVNASATTASNATFTVSGVTGTTPTYQWQENTGSGWANITNGGVYSGATLATLTISSPPIGMSGYQYQCVVSGASPCASATSTSATLTVTIATSNLSDLFYVTGSSAATISSTMNDAAPLTASTGIQAMQFLLRDGGAAMADSDIYPTILTGFTISQVSNTATNWVNAIKTIALFDGSTWVANGVISASNIVFSGLSISAPDNGFKTLSLRMSLNCPLNTVSDNEYFGFSIAWGSTTVSTTPTSSTMTTFTAVKNTPNAGGTLKINVVAPNLVFTQQPTTIGVNTPMMDTVIVKALDACGNVDKDFVGIVSLTSTGTMTGSPLTATAVAGVATFTNIIHTIIGTGYTLTASTSGITSAVSTAFDIVPVTVMNKGDLAIIAVNTNIGGGNDQIAFVSFVDIMPGTTLYITDNGYQSAYANQWGGTEGVIYLTRTGTMLPKGTIVVVEGVSASGNVTSGTDYKVYSCGAEDTNWSKSALSAAGIGGFNLNSDDDMWIMQGGTWTNSTTHHSTYSGTVLYGWTESGWQTVPDPTCTGASGSNPCTKLSTIFPGLECFNTVAPTSIGMVKFKDPVTPYFSTSTNGRFDWIALINNTSNWEGYADVASYNAGSYDYKGATTCPGVIIDTDIYVNGKWTGKKDTNWFNCGNWDTLVVPDDTVDVVVPDTTINNQAIVDVTAPYASYYNYIAKSKNLTITGEKVEIATGTSNILEVHGNLLIDSAGALDMDDSNNATTDGILKLYGNWTNNVGNVAFSEGNGLVQFLGTTPQIISNVTPEGTETFYNLQLSNNFDTAVSNNIIATGNVTVDASKTLTINTNNYVEADINFTNNGTVNIENTGALYQVDDAGVDTGNISMKRTASIRQLDYVYWSSPIKDFNVSNVSPGTNPGRIYKWNATYSLNPNGGEGYWEYASGNSMVAGKGYIVRGPDAYTSTAAPYTAQFINNTSDNGKPNNGVVTIPIEEGTMTTSTLSSYTSVNGIPFTVNDDNWNLVGNPYPSSINAITFLQYNAVTNPVIEGAVRMWTHGTLPNSTISNPFYNSYMYNYTTNDYITYNSSGASSGPSVFNGFIGAGQGFFVLKNEVTPSSTATLTFNNSMRAKASGNNSQFYRNNSMTSTEDDKHRIWLDIINSAGSAVRTLVGYIPNATLSKDVMYDAFAEFDGSMNLYSLINTDKVCIQGRPVPFDENDTVPLGVVFPASGNYTIAIGAVDGLFEQGQDIYLEDMTTNTINDLRAAPYSFTSVAGDITDRFVLRYTNPALSTNGVNLNENGVKVAVKNSVISIKSINEKITDVTVYDLLGREVMKKNKVSENEVILNTNLKNQTLIVKIQLENGTILNKKVVI